MPGHPADNLIHVGVGILRRQDQGDWWVLVARRRPDQLLGGLWEFPGGKIEPGETPQTCTVREFQEELAVQVQVEKVLPRIGHRYDHGLVYLWPCLCRWLAGEPQPRQVAEFKWVRLQELATLTFPPANAGLVRDLMAGKW